ncbi:hypothetical protein [Liquorilactobacillus satsumensis]|uniref:hypothetical protein n=1 Tax=Liquorilactobacillus satsumensis TaxID=259059 RepID=UPI0039ED0766
MSDKDAIILVKKRINTIARVKLLRIDRTILSLGILLISLPMVVVTVLSKGNVNGYSLMVAVYTVILTILLTCLYNYKDKIDDFVYEVQNIEDKLEVYGYDKYLPKKHQDN